MRYGLGDVVPDDAVLSGDCKGDDELHRSTVSPLVVLAMSIAWRWRAEARLELADTAELADGV
jgi:hypothetical protein